MSATPEQLHNRQESLANFKFPENKHEQLDHPDLSKFKEGEELPLALERAVQYFIRFSPEQLSKEHSTEQQKSYYSYDEIVEAAAINEDFHNALTEYLYTMPSKEETGNTFLNSDRSILEFTNKIQKAIYVSKHGEVNMEDFVVPPAKSGSEAQTPRKYIGADVTVKANVASTKEAAAAITEEGYDSSKEDMAA